MSENVFYFKKNKSTINTLIIKFEAGIVGFETCKNFILKKIVNQKINNFGETFLLESIESENVKFFALKIKNNNQFMKKEDFLQISEHLNIKKEKINILYIMNISSNNISMDARAPLIINLENKIGWQMILDKEYKMKHNLWCKYA